MTDRPYTDEDLRTEAARQHYTATTDPDFMGIGEQMEDSVVASTDDGDTGLTWHELLVPQGAGASYKAYGEAQRAIDELLGKAADVSEWAINLGADGLEPSDDHAITLEGDGKPIARIHFAFEPGMPEEMRTALVEGIGQAIGAHLH